MAAAYVRRARSLEQRGRPVPRARQAAFLGGIAVIALALVSPIAHLGEEVFVAHMAQHLLLADIGALLVVIGLTGPVIAPLLRVRAIDRLRFLAHPGVAFPLWLTNLYVWHLPVLYQGTLVSEPLHAAMHAGFVTAGALAWMPLFGPLPKPEWFGSAGKLVYVVALRFGGAVLANVLLWSEVVLYPDYAPGRALWSIGALADQGAAGAVMMIEESILTVCLLGWVFVNAGREADERQELLELAAARGADVDEARVRRAVNAGRGRELRERIERSPPRESRDRAATEEPALRPR
ncbi:MAG: cytochrome c oxidase assembly protein [Thermoleophilaceae bacterium]